MERTFLPVDVKRVIAEHMTILNGLEAVQENVEIIREEIETAADHVIADEVLRILRDIPVEELNRNRGGIRVKALKDWGYDNIAHLVSLSVYSLSAIKGISEDTAYTIKDEVAKIANQARKGVKIRLSTDHRTSKSGELVTALYKYRRIQKLAEKAAWILQNNRQQVEYDLQDAAPGTANALKWVFLSKVKQRRSIDAYERLNEMLDSEYGTSSRKILQIKESLDFVDRETAWSEFARDSIRYINILEEVAPELLGNDDIIYGLPEDLASEIQDECFFPDGLKCKLRPYQEWGVKYILHQERVLLGDEMGLGKTVQSIAAMVSLKNTGATHFVVVCPASVITNWCREIVKHSMLRAVKVHGTGRMEALRSWIRNGGVAVTTYETTGHFQLEEDFEFTMLTVDEAHYVKNENSQRSKNVRTLAEHAQRLLFMTGTALENKVDEMVSLISVLQPDVARRIMGMEALSAAPEFRRRVAPVYYRRKRTDVLTELPSLIESREWCTLSAQEEQVYEKAILDRHYAEARRVSWNIDDVSKSSKAKRVMEIVEEAESEQRKVIIFSFFLDTIRRVKELFGTRCMNPINGSVSVQRRQEIIDEFDRAPAGTVLVAQIQSGGTGLNIQSASVVIICEPQVKPSIENQAISRAYRMGQSRDVLVYRLLCENTIEERMVEILDKKQRIFDAFADKSVAAEESLELDQATFGKLIEEEIERINQKNKYSTPAGG